MTVVSVLDLRLSKSGATGFRLYLQNSSIYLQRNNNAFTRPSEVILLTNSLTVTMPLCQFNGTKNSKHIHIFIMRYFKMYLKKKVSEF